MKNTNVVYTCITNNYDKLICQKPDGNFDYVIFLDEQTFHANPDIADQYKDIQFKLVDRIMSGIDINRFYKINPHLVLPEYENSVYIDGNISLKQNPFNLTPNLHDSCIQLYSQPDRNCAYAELDELVRVGLVYGPDAYSLKKSFRTLGLPHNSGLFEANIIYRSHHEEACKTLMMMWWRLWCNATVKRDQPLLALLNFLSDGKYITSIGKSYLRDNSNTYFEYGTRVHIKRRIPRLIRRVRSEMTLYRRG